MGFNSDTKEFLNDLENLNDVKIVKFKSNNIKYTLVYQIVMSNFSKINDNYIKFFEFNETDELDKIYPGIFSKIETDMNNLEKQLFSGMSILFDNTNKNIYQINLESVPRRNTEDALSSNSSLTSSRDGFIESMLTNIALVRNRLKTSKLICKEFEKGEYSKTPISLLYIEDIANNKFVNKIKKELETFECDAVLSIHMIKELFSQNKLFPTVTYTGKPDQACTSLMQGRCLLIVDNFPLAIILPVNITNFLAFNDEVGMPKYYTVFSRLLSLTTTFISIYFLGIVTALILHHQRNISLLFLSSIRYNRQGVPFTFAVEVFLILIIFEIYSYAAKRAPQQLIQSVMMIIGGIILGQALVATSFASVISMVIVALPFISSFVIANNVLLQFSFTIQRVCIFLLAVFLGLYGVVIGALFFTTYAFNTKSLGLPYLSPLAPFDKRDMYRFLAPRNDTTVQSRPDVTESKKRSLK